MVGSRANPSEGGSWEMQSGGVSVSSADAQALASPSSEECERPDSDRSHVPHGAVNGSTMRTTSHVANSRDKVGIGRRTRGRRSEVQAEIPTARRLDQPELR